MFAGPPELWVVSTDGSPQQALWCDDGKVSHPLPPPRSVSSPVSLTERWVVGDVSNFEYLMAVNAAAGRYLGSYSHHPVLPWVTDFTVERGGWRDLTQSKYRLHKGDAQLDFTFAQQSSEAHHVPEPPLSSLSYFVYLARVTPLEVLRQHVRSVFRPAEYPARWAVDVSLDRTGVRVFVVARPWGHGHPASWGCRTCAHLQCGCVSGAPLNSMTRMYTWTPDECVPAFYMDASVLKSQHTEHGLCDIGTRWRFGLFAGVGVVGVVV